MFDPNGILVCAHAMIRAVAIADHLVDVAVAINDVMRRDLAAIWILKFCESSRKRSLSAVHDDLVDPGSIAARMIRALNELFDCRFCIRITAAMTILPESRGRRRCWFRSRCRCYRYGSER